MIAAAMFSVWLLIIGAGLQIATNVQQRQSRALRLRRVRGLQPAPVVSGTGSSTPVSAVKSSGRAAVRPPSARLRPSRPLQVLLAGARPFLIAVSCAFGAGVAARYMLGLNLLLALSLAAGTALIAFFWLTHIGAQRRRRRFILLLPDAIDLVIRAMRAGLPVSEAFQSVAQELPDDVAAPFVEIHNTLMIGMSFNDAVATTAKRLAITEFHYLAVSINLQQETGGNLSEVLQNLSSTLRRREQTRLKIRSLSSEARSSALIISLLPFALFAILYLLNKSYVLLLFSNWLGIGLIIAGLFSMCLGILTMKIMLKTAI